MELQGAIESLRALRQPCAVTFYTDSQYVRQGVLSWMAVWKMNGWKTKKREPVKNEDLWRQLDAEVQRHRVEWHWLKGHAGHAGNERCDVLAGEAIAKIRETHTPAQLAAALAELEAVTKPAPVVDDLFSG